MKKCRRVFRKAISVFFEYDTPRIVHIRSKKIGILSRFIQLVILAYIIGYVLVYKKGYQDFGEVESVVVTKVKGVSYTKFNFTESSAPVSFRPLYDRVWDVADYVIPPLENGAVFVMTNMIITPNQTRGKCDEDPDVENAICNPNNNTCEEGVPFEVGNGVMTGKCIQSTVNVSLNVCEIEAWCPVEVDENLLKNQAVLEDSKKYTLLIKNSIEFPTFGSQFKRQNILNATNKDYLRKCHYDAETDPFCPIFRLGDIVAISGQNYSEVALKGALISVIIKWSCNLDWNFDKYCKPEYHFRRLDDPHSPISPGFNFRYAQYYEYNRRTLFKASGIHFVISVQGQAGKFSIVPLLLNIGSGMALLGVATILCDLILLYLMKNRNYYKDKKYLDVKGDDAFETSGDAHEVPSPPDSSDYRTFKNDVP